MSELKVTPAMYREFVAGLFYRNEGDLSKDFAHAVLGISSEAFEIARASDAVNVAEEAGDMMFFTVAAVMVLKEFMEAEGITLEHVGGPLQYELLDPAGWLTPVVGDVTLNVIGLLASEDAIMTALEKMQSVAKAWVGYGKKPDADTITATLGALLLPAAAAFGVMAEGEPTPKDVQTAALANIKKLQHRYPGGFSVEKATNRDLEGERSAIESALPK